MTKFSLNTLQHNPFGRTIIHTFADLDKGSYALLPDEKTGRTKLLKLTKSHGTDFYRYQKTINFPFDALKSSNLIPTYTVELNASPAGSESQQYEDALVFSV